MAVGVYENNSKRRISSVHQCICSLYERVAKMSIGSRYLGALILKPDLYDSDTQTCLSSERLSHLRITQRDEYQHLSL